MKKKKSKKTQPTLNKKNQELGQTKNSAKLILFILRDFLIHQICKFSLLNIKLNLLTISKIK
jgi:hypothetical protein